MITIYLWVFQGVVVFLWYLYTTCIYLHVGSGPRERKEDLGAGVSIASDGDEPPEKSKEARGSATFVSFRRPKVGEVGMSEGTFSVKISANSK